MNTVVIRFLFPFLLLIFCSFPAMASLNLILPTHNDNLYEHPENFYMKTDRAGPDAWMGGMYGFSRDAKNVAGGTVNTRFHEGMDIAPMMRDERGEPLDTVMAIDGGTVVYVNPVAGRSNYGKYIVVRHYWNGSPFFSLYAHLNETWVDSGQEVNQGDALGKLGYTGDGINRARAHLHFEITMLVNENFQKWYNVEFGDNANAHGFYNGINLAGLNVARLYQRLKTEPNLTIRDFLSSEHTPFYTVLIPREGRLDLLARYPWLLKQSAMPHDPTWEITFDASGLPLSVKPSKKEVTGPTISWIADTSAPYSYLTKSYVRGDKAKPSLSSSGERFIRLVAIEQDSTAPALIPAQIAAPGGHQKGTKGKPAKPAKAQKKEEEVDQGIAEGSGDEEGVSAGVTGEDVRPAKDAKREEKGTTGAGSVGITEKGAEADEVKEEKANADEGTGEEEEASEGTAQEKGKGEETNGEEVKGEETKAAPDTAHVERGGNEEG